jgi:NitT/TauT family transport system substrate-binding protein
MALVACGSDDDKGGGGGGSTSAEGGTTKVEMLLSYQESIYWVPLLIAQDQGYFEEEGVEVDVKATEGSGFVTQQIIAGNADFGWAAAADDVIALSKDDSLRALSCNPERNIFRIVVKEDSDIQTVEDLKGKTLGFTEAGGGEEPIINATLGDLGYERNKDVKLLPIGAAGPASKNAIENGQVDAYASSYPDISTLTADGLTFRDITPEKYNAVPGDCLLVKQDVLDDEAKRKQALGIARAWAKGALFSQTNPEAALEIGCKLVPEECQDMAFAEQYMADTIKLQTPADPDGAFGVVPLEGWQTVEDLLTDSKTIDVDVDVETFAASAEIQEFQKEYGDFDRDAVKQAAESFSSAG